MFRLASSMSTDKSSVDSFIASSSSSIFKTNGLVLSIMTFIYTF